MLPLKDSELRYRRLFETAQDGILILDAKTGMIEDVNPYLIKMLGYSREEFIKKKLWEVGAFRDIEANKDAFEALQEDEYIRYEDLPLKTKDGRLIQVEFVSNVYQVGNEKVIQCNIRDNTEHKRIIAVLQEHEKKYFNLLNQSSDGIFIIDLAGNILTVNKAMCTELEFSEEEFLSMKVWDIIPEQYLDQYRERLTKILAGESFEQAAEYEVRGKNGKNHYVEVLSTPHYRGKNIVGFQGIARDITARKQAERALHESEARNRRLIEHLPTVVYMNAINDVSSTIYVSPQIQTLLGYSPQEWLADPNLWSNAVHPEDRQHVLAQVTTTNASKEPFEMEYRMIARDGRLVWVQDQIVLMNELEGEGQLWQGIMLDITERKKAEETIRQYANDLEERVKQRTAELNHTNAELERANRAKDEFLANMSHELRTPLNSILGLSESLLEQRRGVLNSSQEKSLQIIESSGRHLLELISDILDLSKIEAGKFDYYPQPVSVNDVCRASLSFVKMQAARKSIEINYNNETSVGEITADPRRLKQILVNLLTNAVKFTPANGRVTLQVRADLDRELIQFLVIDTGIGISLEDQGQLFIPFFQADGTLTRQFEGTGLGLTLAQKLTDLHGGSIQIESELGKGSCFTVNLHCKQVAPQQFNNVQIVPIHLDKPTEGKAFQYEGDPLNHHRILLAEDNEVNILILGEYLESYGYEVLVAHNGLEAIALARLSSPEIILMDIQMPLMSGLEAMRHLRADSRFASTPIIALTALAMVGDRERCLEAGATEYMSKPVSLDALRQTIEIILVDVTKQVGD